MNERVETTLRFVGDWPAWAGGGLALVLAVATWLLYRRELFSLSTWLRLGLPTLRAVAVAMAALMLSGPVLHHRKTIGELGRLFLFVDGSQSMNLADPEMELGRKLLLTRRLGLMRADVVSMDLPQAAELLAEAQGMAERARDFSGTDAEAWKKMAGDFSAKIGEARELLLKTPNDDQRHERFGRDLYDPARQLASRDAAQIEDRKAAAAELAKFSGTLFRWRGALDEAFQRTVGPDFLAQNPGAKSALEKFESMTRQQRLQALLLEGEQSKLLERLATAHDIELLALDKSEATRIWQPTKRDSTLPASLPSPNGNVTNLATGVRSGVGETEGNRKGAVILFSDGQHNEGESPIEIAKVLGGRALPVFTVGMGGTTRPRDLAVLRADGPESVFYQDRVRGTVAVKDDVPAGQPFTVTISDGDKAVWTQQFTTENKGVRKIPFDFPVTDVVKPRLDAGKAGGFEISGVPLELKVAVSAVEGDKLPGNNAASLRFRAVTQKRKMLILDGRPRWETRYVRNMFERDEQWEVNTVVVGMKPGEESFQRGSLPEQFPKDRAMLDLYDLVIFGEMPLQFLKKEEMEWLRDFVAVRGGAMLFVDGARGRFKDYAKTPLGSLFPVEWTGPGYRDQLGALSPTDRGAQLAAFALAGDKQQSADVWVKLPAPRWLAQITPLPGTDVLLEMNVAGKKVPAALTRQFGAGRVFYHGFDESWRWRYETADLHHVRYWNQIANWSAEMPFAVRDRLVSLDAGAITYQPGASADLRVRLRDGEGKPVANATVDAVLYRDGKKAATIRLTADEAGGGLFRGNTAPLEPGAYEAAVESAAIAAQDSKARASFKVEPRETGELTMLNLDEDLLRQMSAASGGQYLREENVDRLVEMLAPLSNGRVIESDTVLWQSWWWFVPLVLLLALEWTLRKRYGLL